MVKGYENNVWLKKETILLLNKARAKIIIEQNINGASADLVINTALKKYLGE